MGLNEGWFERDLLDAFYKVVDDFKTGFIDEKTLKERLLQLAERYERNLGPTPSKQQDGLF